MSDQHLTMSQFLTREDLEAERRQADDFPNFDNEAQQVVIDWLPPTIIHSITEEPSMSDPADIQVEVDMAVRNAWLASRELYRLSLDPKASSYLATMEGDLWSAKGSLSDICERIREGHAHA